MSEICAREGLRRSGPGAALAEELGDVGVLRLVPQGEPAALVVLVGDEQFERRLLDAPLAD